MTKSTSSAGIGRPVARKEDAELLTGQGRFSDDVELPGQAHAVMVRSPHAHARIRGIDTAAAMALPGRARRADRRRRDRRRAQADPAPADHRAARHRARQARRVRQVRLAPPLLPHDKARFAGEAVAMVVADSVSARQGRRRARARGFRAAAGGDRYPRRGGGGRPAAVGRGFLQRLHRCRGRRRRGDRGGVRTRGPCGAARRPGSSASPACRWSRAPPSATTTRQRAAPRSMPAAAASCARSTSSPAFSTSRRNACASSPATSAAISARATRSIPSSRWSPGRRGASAGRSNGRASATRRFSATIRGAISSSTPSWRSTATAISSRCAARTSAMSARTPSRSCR